MDCRETNYVVPGLFIEDLETFEMVGLEPATAYEVIAYLQTDIKIFLLCTYTAHWISFKILQRGVVRGRAMDT